MGVPAAWAERAPLAPLLPGEKSSLAPLLQEDWGERQSATTNESLLAPVKDETSIRRVRNLERVSTNAADFFAQQTTTPIAVIQVTGVKANPTDNGVEVILQTAQGEKLQIANRSAGNSYIADIPNAQLRLPNGDAFVFRSQEPVAGITEITVTNFDANTIRVTVTGEAGVPTIELFDSPEEGLIFGVVSAATSRQQQPQTQPTPQEQPGSETQPSEPSAEGEEEIEIVVTGEQDGYRVPNASVGTRTDTPLRDIPQSIQVVPQEVLRDQNVTRQEEALRNVSGVVTGNPPYYQGSFYRIRGFLIDNFSGNNLLNGLPDFVGGLSTGFSNVERVEVLKGPVSVLFGQGSPGGTINVITRQPLREPFYEVNATIGNYDFYQGAIDFSGPLDSLGNVLYRLNTSYRSAGSSIDRIENDNFQIAPVLSWAISDRTNLTIEGDYVNDRVPPPTGVPALGSVLSNPNGEISRNRNYNEAKLLTI